MVKAKDIVSGKIQLETLPQLYTFLVDGDSNRLAQAVNILATKKRYRVASHSKDKYGEWSVCMEKEGFFNHKT